MASPKKRSAQVSSSDGITTPYAVPGVTDGNNNLVKHRLRTTGDIQSAFMQLWDADQSSTYNRAIQQADIDGNPPFSQDWAAANGASGRINVNFGFSRRMMEQHELPYTDLLESSGTLFSIGTKWGDKSSRNFTEPLLSQGISRMLRNWRPYNYLYQKRAQIFVREGLSITFYDDDNNWQWQVMGQQNMKFPRESIPCEDMLDCCGCKVDMLTSDLARYTSNAEIAKEEGWDPAAVTEALRSAKPRSQYIQNDYQHWQAKWKDNDVLWSVTAPVVETIHFWIREVDDTVSHYICRFDGQGDILFKSEGKYERFSRLLTLFPYGIGTNGDLQSCRGMGAFGYQSGNAMNRIFCAYMEMAMHAGTPHITCASEDGVNDLPMRRQGPYMTLQNGTQFVETHPPNFGDTLIPLFGLTSQIFQNNTQGTGMMPTQALERKTNLQEQNEMAREGSLSSSQMALFFASERRHLMEVVRRIIRPNYRVDEPGGREVDELKVWLSREGVPLEALYAIDIDSLEVNTGIGRGSRMNRLNTVYSLMEDYYRYDRKGQNYLLNMKASILSNPQVANELVPLEEGQRPGEQVQVAVNENGLLVSRNQVQIDSVVILPDQDHAAHVETHISFLGQLWPMTQGAQDPTEAFEVIAPLWEHATSQWEFMDPESPAYKQAKMDLRQMGEWVTNTSKQLAAAQQKAALEGQPEEEGAIQQNITGQMHALDAEAKMADVAAKRAKLDMDTAREEMKLQFQQQTHAQKLQQQAQMFAIQRAAKIQDLNAKLNLDEIKARSASRPKATAA